MRKLVSLVLLIVIMFSFSACSSRTYEGIEKFHPSSSSYGVCAKLVPEGLLENYTYLHGNYFYNEDDSFNLDVGPLDEHTALMYLIYEDSMYASAKEYTFNNLFLEDTVFTEFNGYVFYINLRYHNVREDEYPCFYNMVAFNDNKNEIVFFGLYVSYYYYDYKEIKELENNFAEHLKYFYGEWYNFFDQSSHTQS